jgi:hypothetical protein
MEMDRMSKNVISTISAGLLASGLFFASGPAALAQDMIDADTRQVLSAMSDYVSGLEAFSAVLETSYEIVGQNGMKVQAIATSLLAVKRPDKVHMRRIGSVMDVEVVRADGTLTLCGTNLNAYHQTGDQASIEQAIDTLRHDLGFPAPGADFIAIDLVDRLLTEGTSGVHLGMTTLAGAAAHHLAFRNNLVDWQLWVADGDHPVPLRYVVTNKWVTAAPQFTLQFRSWDVNPIFGDATFTFTAPADAQEVEVLSLNLVGELVVTEE